MKRELKEKRTLMNREIVELLGQRVQLIDLSASRLII
jgi:hypothetical protein